MATHVRACVDCSACIVVRGGHSLGIIGCQDGYVYRTARVRARAGYAIRAIVADSAAWLGSAGDGSVYGMPARYIRGLRSSRGYAVTGAAYHGRRVEGQTVATGAGHAGDTAVKTGAVTLGATGTIGLCGIHMIRWKPAGYVLPGFRIEVRLRIRVAAAEHDRYRSHSHYQYQLIHSYR